jgi:hypothetical protein
LCTKSLFSEKNLSILFEQLLAELLDGQPRNGCSIPAVEIDFPFFLNCSDLLWGPPGLQWVPVALSLELKRPAIESDPSPQSSAEVKNQWSRNSTHMSS